MNTKMYDEIAEKGVITERQILTIKNRMNNGIGGDSWRIFSRGTIRITPEQTEKGIKWLLDKYKTPRGAIRKNNPFRGR